MKKINYFLLLTILVVVVFLSIVVFVNSRIPYGDHILIASGITKPSEHEAITSSSFISKKYIDILGVRCEFQANKATDVLDSKDAIYSAVPAMFVFFDLYGQGMNKYDNEFFTNLTYAIISSCDKNSLLHKKSPPPLIYAILSKRPDFVKKMLESGADKNFFLSRPGRPTNGMSPLDFAKHLLSMESDQTNKKNLKEIAELLSN